MTIVGIVGDVRQRGPEKESVPECYMTYLQHGFNGATLSIVVRTAGDPGTLEASLRRLAGRLSPDVPMKFTTMQAIVSGRVAVPRFRTLLFVVFAGLAMCLAIGGVYGVMEYRVSQQSNEIGLRIALGATTGTVVRLVIRQGLVLTGLGLVIGLGIAIGGSRLLTTILFEVRPDDPFVYLAVVILIGVSAFLASYLPARRISRIDPLSAIQQE
jgi:ABC-type antimicrobial peptide transport system permease subunit